MCKCKNIEIGSYGNQVLLSPLPPHMADYKLLQGGSPVSICVDKCLEKEIKALWSEGVTTTGCCCGHGRSGLAYIGVIDADINWMKAHGYKVWRNECRPNDHDSFIPMTVNYVPLELSVNNEYYN